MLTFNLKRDEQQRLRALRRHGLLDTLPEAEYDDIVRLAAGLCDVPIALISLVDSDRQWFKANQGLPGVAETERCISFCTHAIEQEGLFVIEDATRDERFASNALVQGFPFIRFYAGAPIQTEDGYQLGTLCVIDRRPRQLSEAQRSHLLALKRQVELLLRLRLQVRQAHERNRQLLQGLGDAVFLLDEAGRVLEVNPVAERLLGVEGACLVGTSFESLAVAEAREGVRQALEELLARGTMRLADLELTAARGGRCSLDLAASLQEVGDSRRLLLVGHDLTEKRRLEEQNMQNDRLAAMGALAAGIAHEINNPISYVLSNLGYLQRWRDELERELAAGPSLPTNPAERLSEAREVISESLDGCTRIHSIVSDMRFFSHKPDGVLAPVNVNASLDFVLRMAHSELMRTARLVKSYAPELPAVLASEGRLSQVFLNLIINALQAMQPGAPQRHVLCVRTWHEGGRVCMSVSDTGHGIPAEVLPRIFDPFFTTKPAGAGTGLGLSISHALIRKMGGELSVHSEQGRGTTFTLWLPTAEPASEQPVLAS